MIEYLACGNIMSDIVEQEDGTCSELHIGGPAMYGLSGIRLWTDRCKLVTQTGEDYKNTYGKWMDDNGLSHESILTELEEGTCHILNYNRKDGGFNHRGKRDNQYLGYLKTHPYHIETACEKGVRGIYMAQDLDRVFWKKLGDVKAKYDFRIMWEIEPSMDILERQDVKERIREVLGTADMWSLNHNEASVIFQIPRENDEDMINELMKLPTELTFYRVGKRGAYAVTPTNAWFCPSIDPFGEGVDPTGCGNCSTGAAMYAHVAGYDPLMTVIMANVASGFNAAQYGPYPVYTEEAMEKGCHLAEEMYKKLHI